MQTSPSSDPVDQETIAMTPSPDAPTATTPLAVEPAPPDWAGAIRRFTADLARARGRPALLLCHVELERRHVLPVAEAMSELADGQPLDLVLESPGGDVEAAYLIARELRRQVSHLTAFVPYVAKSAATLLCLAADELVLGDLGELGPLDAQRHERQKGDFPMPTSGLAPFQSLEQLQQRATGMYDHLVRRIVSRSGMRVFEAGSKAAELTSALYSPIYAQIDPHRLAESARSLEVGAQYAEKVLRRYRPEVFARHGRALVERLVRAYPSHGFILDLEELEDLGLPARASQGDEVVPMGCLGFTCLQAPDDVELIELISPAGAKATATPDRASPRPTTTRGRRRHATR
jgi:hypothetical protein